MMLTMLVHLVIFMYNADNASTLGVCNVLVIITGEDFDLLIWLISHQRYRHYLKSFRGLATSTVLKSCNNEECFSSHRR